MEQSILEKMLKMMTSSIDADAIMGLRAVQGLFETEGVSLAQALLYAAANVAMFRPAAPSAVAGSAIAAAKPTAVVNASGMPDCRVPKAGHIEIVLSGKSVGEPIALPGGAAADAEGIAAGFKDALVAAVINKSKFKLKLIDVKDKRGEIVETVLQAEYERPGMIPVRIWGNVKGEVAALAAILRKAVANNLPELAAA